MQGETNWDDERLVARFHARRMTLAMPVRLRPDSQVVGCVVAASPSFSMDAHSFRPGAQLHHLHRRDSAARNCALIRFLAQRLALPDSPLGNRDATLGRRRPEQPRFDAPPISWGAATKWTP